jgi:hypothetical protein
MSSTTGGGPTDLDQLRADYGDRWDIDVDGQQMIHAKQRGVPIGDLPSSRWAWDAGDLRTQLAKYEAEQVAFQTGDLP